MGGKRREALVLSSTKSLLNSLFTSSLLRSGDGASHDLTLPELRLNAGILRVSHEYGVALVGLSTTALKRLSLTSASPVVVRNVDTGTERIARVSVLDPPGTPELSPDAPFSAQGGRELLVFPSYCIPAVNTASLDPQVAYLSPLLAFNLGLHLTCFKTIVHHGDDTLGSYFEAQVDDGKGDRPNGVPLIDVELKPVVQLPRYASHVRVSFVKIPECGTFESLKETSSVEVEDRQEIIDRALQEYFKTDRYLAAGDVFCVKIEWSCNSVACISCGEESRKNGSIYFKVVALEPSEDRILRINCSQTALVLARSVPSALPPDLWCDYRKVFAPLHGDTVKNLASVLMPPLCSSGIAAKYRVAVLLSGSPGCGKRTVVRHVARRLGLHVVEISCNSLISSSDKKTSSALAEAFHTARRYSPTILLLRHFDSFRNLGLNEGFQNDQVGIASEVASILREFTVLDNEDKGVISTEKENNDLHGSSVHGKVFLVAAAESLEGISPIIRRCFSHELSMNPLTEEQRAEVLEQSLKKIPQFWSNNTTEDFVKDLVAQTSGYMPRDLNALIADAGVKIFFDSCEVTPSIRQDEFIEEKLGDKKDTTVFPSEVAGRDVVTKVLERSKKRNAAALGTPKVPNVKWEDVGGLEDVKKSILDTVQLPLLHKDLFSSGLRKRSGVLLYGPPGTGKTLLAKAVATECSLNFLSVKGPELINMYIGESEKNVRDIFQKARAARPCVIFFDELDSLAPARGATGDSGGVMDRVVSQMLAEIDGLNDTTQDLFIIGASNRPDLIDPALLRPGRFDKLLYVGVNAEASYRERVLRALTRKFKLHEDVSLFSIAKRCPPNFTGADMYALCADAWFHAAKRKVLSSEMDSKEIEADSIVVEYVDFVEVLVELSPSLSMAELKKYEQLRDQFESSSN
ncbi:hypothetical protein MLD38_038996 [Melastoma candidum]|uniref:Uncharacterized protein n=1 Tax=Melastoma candidum TaxID=119954 RepID=A0ACB9L1W8_9MYRT|nr:hypothetical protein MLD38_038996 [Melastoma candidum]